MQAREVEAFDDDLRRLVERMSLLMVDASGVRSRAEVVRLGVAATAPFGADVLERLAARHEIAFLLTRPDRPRGRGRRVAPPPAKLVAERLGVPVLQPERLTKELELPGDT